MADFLFSAKNTNIPNSNKNNNSNNTKNKTKNTKIPMFGGDYSNNKKKESTNNNNKTNIQQTNPKKIPMFGNINKSSQNNSTKKSFSPTFENIKIYQVSNEENVKMLNELKELIDHYINEFSNVDKMKISFLFDKLGKDL